MEPLEPPRSIESLRAKVAAHERERARLHRELAAPAGDPRLRAVQVAVLALLAVSFGFGLCAGVASTSFPHGGEHRTPPDTPLPVVQMPN
jgi:hypothetical protein